MGIAVGAPCPECATPAHSPAEPPTWQSQSRRVHWCWRLGGLAWIAGLVLIFGHGLIVRTYFAESLDLVLNGDKAHKILKRIITLLPLALLPLAPALLTVPTTLLTGWRRGLTSAAFIACVVFAVAGCVPAVGYFLLDFAPRTFWGTHTARFINAALANLNRVSSIGFYITSALATFSLLLVAIQVRARVLAWTAGVGLGLLLLSWLGSALLPRDVLQSALGQVVGTPATLSTLAIAFLAWHRGWTALRSRPLN